MSKSARFIKFKTKPGKRDEVRRIWENYARDYVAGSDRTLSFCYSYDDNDPDTVILFQLAADQDSGQEFAEQPWFADYQRETFALVDQSEVETATPQWIKDAAGLSRA